MEKLSYGERIAKGVEFLDRVAPQGWIDLVDTEALNINNPNYCVLGQVFQQRGWDNGSDGYNWIRREHFSYLMTAPGGWKMLTSDEWALADHGFRAYVDAYDESIVEHGELTTAWRSAIYKLRMQRRAQERVEWERAMDELTRTVSEERELALV